MRAKVKYGVPLAGVGLLLWLAGLRLDTMAVSGAGFTALVAGGVLLYLAYEKWYCAACGQYLGRGSKPSRCDRCGSNRVTNSDPGAKR